MVAAACVGASISALGGGGGTRTEEPPATCDGCGAPLRGVFTCAHCQRRAPRRSTAYAAALANRQDRQGLWAGPVFNSSPAINPTDIAPGTNFASDPGFASGGGGDFSGAGASGDW